MLLQERHLRGGWSAAPVSCHVLLVCCECVANVLLRLRCVQHGLAGACNASAGDWAGGGGGGGGGGRGGIGDGGGGGGANATVTQHGQIRDLLSYIVFGGRVLGGSARARVSGGQEAAGRREAVCTALGDRV